MINTAQFPQSVVFPTTPLGQSKTKTLSLKCDVPIDFEFELSFLEEHPAFTVAPMKGEWMSGLSIPQTEAPSLQYAGAYVESIKPCLQ